MSNALSDLSDALANAVKTASPSLVRVEARRRMPATGIIWSADGLIITSHHVVERDDNIKIVTQDGTSHAATLVGRDPSTDIAILRIQASGLTVPNWADTDSLSVGHLILALGRPHNSVLATHGIISALSSDSWRAPTGGRVDRYLQTDAVMYPGFSGGPSITANGQFIGVNTSALLPGTSLVIPTPTLKRVAESILSHGRVRQGYLGVGSQPVRLPPTLTGELGQETGLLLVSVESNSPAEKSNLFVGDILVGGDGQAIRGMDDLLVFLSGGDRVGTTVPMKIVRGGQVQELNVTIGERQ